VTQAYCAYAKKHEFDAIDTIDILDCNGGDHGYAFATNFNPEINLREVSAPGSYWENGHWVEIPPMSIRREYDFDRWARRICTCSTTRKLSLWPTPFPRSGASASL
jgi:saccharopine dehydrogenase (NAD+, L-lysine-forming)